MNVVAAAPVAVRVTTVGFGRSKTPVVFEALRDMEGATVDAITVMGTVTAPPQVKPLQTASWTTITTGAAPGASVGARNVCVGSMVLAFCMITTGPDNCCQVKISGSAGRFESVLAAPLRVTSEP